MLHLVVIQSWPGIKAYHRQQYSTATLYTDTVAVSYNAKTCQNFRGLSLIT